MRTLTLALILAAPAFAPALADQPPAPPAPPAAPAPATPPAPPPVPVITPDPLPVPVIAPKAGDILPEAQAIFDRAIAAYQGAKNYRESVVTTLRQKASGLPKEAEPPADQASTTNFVWAGPDHFALDTRDFGLFRDGKQSTITVKALGEYVQREPNDEDQRVFANMVDLNPVYQAITHGVPGSTIGRVATVTKVEAETLGGVKGKRITGTGLPPLPGFELISPVTMFFADDSGLLTQATYDLKTIMQGQIDKSRAANPAAPAPPITIDEFLITSDWSSVKVDDDAAAVIAAATFKPAAGDKKVDEFNMSDAETSAQHELLNKPAPDFSAKTLNGKPVALKDVKGKVVLLQFWATATGISTRALTVFNSMNMEYADKGVAMFGVNMDHATMTEQSKRIAAAKLAAYPQIADPDKAIGNAYRVALVPCTILIDKEGVIRSISHEFDAASQIVVAGKLDKLLRGEPLGDEPKPAPFISPAAMRPATPPAAPAPKPIEEPKQPAEEPKKP